MTFNVNIGQVLKITKNIDIKILLWLILLTTISKLIKHLVNFEYFLAISIFKSRSKKIRAI